MVGDFNNIIVCHGNYTEVKVPASDKCKVIKKISR